jgi:uncharacterized protein YndB with AHSA1/START domain
MERPHSYQGGWATDIAAPAELVWSLVSDPEPMPEWSPEVQAIEWLDGATEAAKGASFMGRTGSACCDGACA